MSLKKKVLNLLIAYIGYPILLVFMILIGVHLLFFIGWCLNGFKSALEGWYQFMVLTIKQLGDWFVYAIKLEAHK